MPVQLGDSFTLTYLRVCGPECMFIVAYDYLYEIGEHKSFRNSLYDMQNAEDRAERDRVMKEVADESLRMLGESFKANPGLLTMPMPHSITQLFAEAPTVCCYSSTTIKFTRPTKKQKIKWAKDRVKRLEGDLLEAELDLAKAENGD